MTSRNLPWLLAACLALSCLAFWVSNHGLLATNAKLRAIEIQSLTERVPAKAVDWMSDDLQACRRRLETCERDLASARTSAQGSLQAYVEAAQQLEFCKLGRQVR